MSKIFISYSRENQDVIKILALDFQEFGHEVWVDKELTGGQAWWEQILDNIRKCDLFVFAVSRQSVDSQACKLERTYANALNKAILPVLIADDVSIKMIAHELSALHFVDYIKQDKQAAFSLNKALINLPDIQPLPDTLPDEPEVPVSHLGSLQDQIKTTKKLTFEEQSALLLQLRQGLRIQDDIDDVRELLLCLRRRDDLLAKIASEIDSLLNDTGKKKSRRQTDHSQPVPPKNKLTQKNIIIKNTAEDITDILQDVLYNKKTWVLQDSDYILEISSKDNTIVVQAEWKTWANLWSQARMFDLKRLNWTIDMRQMFLASISLLLVIFTYGLALLSQKFRTAVKTHKASRSWMVIENNSQLTNITLDMVLALKTIGPDSIQITANRK